MQCIVFIEASQVETAASGSREEADSSHGRQRAFMLLEGHAEC
jgi:hypothetical protein